MSFWGKEDQEFIKSLKECIQHTILIFVLLIALFGTMWLRDTLFQSNDDILQIIIGFEKFCILTTLVRCGLGITKSLFKSIRKEIQSVILFKNSH